MSVLAVSPFIFPERLALAADADVKIFSIAKDEFSKGNYIEAAKDCWKYISNSQPNAEKYESAQFYLASSLEKLGLNHGAVEFYFQVANNRKAPDLLPRTLRALEGISRSAPFDEGLIIRDLLGNSDFGDLPGDVSDFVHYWQGKINLEQKLYQWTSERFAKINRRGYYFFNALYVAAIHLLEPAATNIKEEALISFARLFGPLDLSAALEAIRRRGEGDTSLALAIKAIINEDNEIKVHFDKLPTGWEIELAIFGLARIAAETSVLLARAKTTDEETLGLPLSYNVSIGGMPIYTRAIRFEERAPAIKEVAARMKSVRSIEGKALHSLARLLYEQQSYNSTYSTLGKIPKGSELESEILLERAWSKYKAGDYRRAMGLVYAMDAPIYENLFAPEKFVLRGLIYRRFCHFRAAKLAARKFKSIFGQTLRMIRDGETITEIPQVREAAMHQPTSRKISLFQKTLEQEFSALDKYVKPWGDNDGLLPALEQIYQQKMRQVKDELERSLEVSSRDVAEEMFQAEEQMNLLEYEIGQSIFQRVQEGQERSMMHQSPAKVPLSSERVYYKFNGEYWSDELRNYRFNIEDRCVE